MRFPQVLCSSAKVLRRYLDGSELSLFCGGGCIDLVCQLLVHHPLARQSILQLRNSPVDPGHLVLGRNVFNVIEMKSIDNLSHGELCSLLSNHVVLLLIELPPVRQLSAQFLQLHNLDWVRLSHIHIFHSHACIALH